MQGGTTHDQARPLPASRPSITLHLDLATVTRVKADGTGRRMIEAGCVRGWAVSPEPVTAIEVMLGGERLATARLGTDRPDVAALFPAFPHAASAGFEAVLTQGVLPPGDAEILLRLRTSGGQFLSVVHPLEIASPTLAEQDATAIRMAVDRCCLDEDGQMRLSGWALARDGVAAVQTFAGGIHLATMLPNHERPDVAGL